MSTDFDPMGEQAFDENDLVGDWIANAPLGPEVPAGTWPARVINAKVGNSQNSGRPGLTITVALTGGPAEGKQMTKWICLRPKPDDKPFFVKGARKLRMQLCTALGRPEQINGKLDVNSMVNEQLAVRISVKAKDEDGLKSAESELDAFLPLSAASGSVVKAAPFTIPTNIPGARPAAAGPPSAPPVPVQAPPPVKAAPPKAAPAPPAAPAAPTAVEDDPFLS